MADKTTEIFDVFLDRMSRLWAPPYRCKDENAVLIEYSAVLARYDVDALSKAMDWLAENRDEKAKYWPSISECIGAVRKVLNVEALDQATPSEWEDEERRRKLANDLMASDLGEQWIEEGIGEYVWQHMFDTEELPKDRDLERFRVDHEAWERWASAYAAESDKQAESVAAFKGMVRDRQRRALSGGAYRPSSHVERFDTQLPEPQDFPDDGLDPF